MFDIGFWEMVVLGAVALVVVGPEQMPELVKTALGYFRHFQRQFRSIRADVERELDMDVFQHETKTLKDWLGDDVRALEGEYEKINQQYQAAKGEIEHWDDPDRFDDSDASLPDPEQHADTGEDAVAHVEDEETSEARAVKASREAEKNQR